MTPLTLTALLLAGLINTGDPVLDHELTLMTLEAKYRKIEVDNPMDEFDRVYFNYEIRRAL